MLFNYLLLAFCCKTQFRKSWLYFKFQRSILHKETLNAVKEIQLHIFLCKALHLAVVIQQNVVKSEKAF